MMRSARLLIADAPLRAAIVFALEAQGMRITIGHDPAGLPDVDGCLIVDIPPHEDDPIGRLQALRREAVFAPMIVLASCPSQHVREAIAAADAILVEKPLLTDALCAAISRLAQTPWTP